LVHGPAALAGVGLEGLDGLGVTASARAAVAGDGVERWLWGSVASALSKCNTTAAG
jgi:hypothetical protein